MLARTISLSPMKSTSIIQNQNSQFANVVVNPLLLIEMLNVCIVPTLCRFSKNQPRRMIIFAINLGYEDLNSGRQNRRIPSCNYIPIIAYQITRN